MFKPEITSHADHGVEAQSIYIEGHGYYDVATVTLALVTEFLASSGFRCGTMAGARYHGVPRPLAPLDRAFCRWPSAASILLVHARKE